jgi:hypothetical protein
MKLTTLKKLADLRLIFSNYLLDETVKYILKDFVEKINVLKLQNSDCFSDSLSCDNDYNFKIYFLLSTRIRKNLFFRC